MTGPQQSRPDPAPRPSPRPRHGRADEDFPEDSHQGSAYPDLRSSRPVERPAPADAGGYQDLYGGPQPMIDDPSGYGGAERTRDEPGGYAAPVRYDGYGAPTPAAGDADRDPGHGGYGAPDAGGYGAPDAGGYRAPDSGGYGAPAYGEYGDPASRGGTAIDGGPPYPAPTPARESAGDTGTAGTAGDTGAAGYSGNTAVAERSEDPTGPAVAVPAQRAPVEGGRRPATVAEAAAERFGTPAAESPGGPRAASAPAVRVAKDPTALTVLRVVTYVLVSLSCLVFLAGVVYGVLSWLELREAFGTSPLFGGSPTFGG